MKTFTSFNLSIYGHSFRRSLWSAYSAKIGPGLEYFLVLGSMCRWDPPPHSPNHCEQWTRRFLRKMAFPASLAILFLHYILVEWLMRCCLCENVSQETWIWCGRVRLKCHLAREAAAWNGPGGWCTLHRSKASQPQGRRQGSLHRVPEELCLRRGR